MPIKKSPAGGKATAAAGPLAAYNAKRDFSKTAEPAGVIPPQPAGALQFVIQKHWASHLHYDLRLELDGVMLSWAVPKGPSCDPTVKSLAIHVEDHPISYNSFEGDIPKGEYGAGTVMVWDRGTWEPVGEPRAALAKGKVEFQLHGQKLAGLWELVRISQPGEKKQDHWLLFKKRGDAWARPRTEYEVTSALPDSVVQKPLGLLEAREPKDGALAPIPPTGTTAALDQAKKAKLPAKLAPQLATLVSSVPAGDWVLESKFDGYRALARIDDKAVRIFTRNGNDWTHKLQPLAQAIAGLGLRSGWLDGEIVVLTEAGVPDLDRLQNAIDSARTQDVVMFVFDLPFLGDMDLRALPLRARRAVLQELLTREHLPGALRFSQAFEATPAQLLDAACRMGLEGVIAKRADAPYVSGRSETWLKLKCQNRQEFVVLGFTERSDAAKQVGSLLLGYYEQGALCHAGAVGTGWNAAMARQLHLKLTSLEVDQSPVSADYAPPGRRAKPGREHWVKPCLVVEVTFAAWTPDKRLRHAVFRGLRTDKPASEVVMERAQAPAASAIGTQAGKSNPLQITHAERVIDPTTGLRKIDLARYYDSIAEWLLPHLTQRPVSLVRAPAGISAPLFFQKHAEHRIAGIKELDPALWPDHAPLLMVDSAQALLAAAQMNVVEFHTWNSTIARIDQPDRFVLDLDPGEGVTWPQLQEAAGLTRVLLKELGLESWLKTSGGKGLHVVVPITPKLDHAAVKAFSQAVVKHMARVIPSRFVAVMGPKNRVGKIFIDYLRNGQGQTTVSAFSARARPGMGVSMPIGWDQLQELRSSAQWTIATARDYLSFQQQDPWHSYWKKKQSLAQGIRMLQ